MSRKPDWIDIAHKFERAIRDIADQLPKGFTIYCSLSAFGQHSGADYSVSLQNKDLNIHESGQGRSIDKAFDAAKEAIRIELEKRGLNPRIRQSSLLELN